MADPVPLRCEYCKRGTGRLHDFHGVLLCEKCREQTIKKTPLKTVADPVKHPGHYKVVPGIECIEVVQHFNFNRGNVIKYVWRAGSKGNEIEDLRKARQYLDFEIKRLEGK